MKLVQFLGLYRDICTFPMYLLYLYLRCLRFIVPLSMRILSFLLVNVDVGGVGGE